MKNTELEMAENKSIVGYHTKPQSINRLEDSLFSKDLAPHYMKLATQLAASEIVPKCFRNKPSDLFLCWAKGYQLGIPPEQAMDCISVINGKAVMWGDDMLALCMAHKDFEDIIEEAIVDSEHRIIGYNCTVKRKGKADKVNIFTLEMAKKAGLLAKGGVWLQYTDRMLKLRARGFTLRDAFPDALKGIKPREEIEDYIDGEYKTVDETGLTRTQLLQKDFLTKTGKLHAEDKGMVDLEETKSVDDKAETMQRPSDEIRTKEKTAELHIEIKRIIDEKSIAEERLVKALTYYEVNSIDELDIESSQNFLEQLSKL